MRRGQLPASKATLSFIGPASTPTKLSSSNTILILFSLVFRIDFLVLAVFL